MARPRPRVTAAVCAYNEVANIGRLLTILLERESATFDELIVVSSGSTDGTDEAVRAFEGAHPKVRLVVEPERRGKAEAVSAALRASSGEVVLLIDADCLPAAGALESLLARFQDDATGGAGSRNVVTNAEDSWVARATAALWELHHDVNLRRPVLGGDIVAFRRVIEALPEGTVNDDYAIEAALKAKDLRVEYEPRARVLMRAPATPADFMRQRRRIYAGYRARTPKGAVKSTQELGTVLAAAVALLRRRPLELPWLVAVTALEAVARASVVVEAMLGREQPYSAWEPAWTTKQAISNVDAKNEGATNR